MDKFEVSGDVALLEKSPEIDTPPFKDKSLWGIRAEIIRDILTSGLKSSERLAAELRPYLRSSDPLEFDENTQPIIDGNVFKPTSKQEELSRQFRNNFYGNSTAALAVVAERADPDDILTEGYGMPISTEKKEVLNQRIRSSFLVACDPEEAKRLHGTGLITPDYFSYVIFPREVWRGYLKVDPYANERFPSVLLAEGYIDRNVDIHPAEIFSVPSYETPIRRILKETGEPIWVHAVRLPTQEDMK